MVDLGTPEDQEISEAKRGILAIEGLFHAINSATYSPRFMDGLHIGLTYIGQLHERLIAQIGPEEVEKMKKVNIQPQPQTNGLVKPN
jgi:hypothetical protein